MSFLAEYEMSANRISPKRSEESTWQLVGLKGPGEPIGDRTRDRQADAAIRERVVLLDLSCRRLHQEVIEAWEPHDLDSRAVVVTLLRELFETIRVPRRHLRVEQSLNDQERLVDIAKRSRRVERQETAKPRRVGLLTQVRRDLFPHCSAQDRLLNALLKRDRFLLLCVGLGGP